MSFQTPLTATEHRVASLLLEGLTNRDIASRLVVSPRTVESHISRALAKTGCRNRLDLALRMLTMPITPA